MCKERVHILLRKVSRTELSSFTENETQNVRKCKASLNSDCSISVYIHVCTYISFRFTITLIETDQCYIERSIRSATLASIGASFLFNY